MAFQVFTLNVDPIKWLFNLMIPLSQLEKS